MGIQGGEQTTRTTSQSKKGRARSGIRKNKQQQPDQRVHTHSNAATLLRLQTDADAWHAAQLIPFGASEGDTITT